jgi:hypothetical protein
MTNQFNARATRAPENKAHPSLHDIGMLLTT